ncbi:MAG: DUF1893 domain-containing protein [Muribaculaceae bacterium]|nr:DUF1893 domain-containing protein [Muribaculaceae bacterium]
MKSLKDLLSKPDVRGVVRTTDCEIIEFHSSGVKDLFHLLATRPDALKGAYVADRVIGRGAALLLVLGQVKQVFAQLISEQAVGALHDAGIMVDYDTMVPNIINRDGTDICPVEKLTMTISQPDLAFEKIKEFLTTNNII